MYLDNYLYILLALFQVLQLNHLFNQHMESLIFTQHNSLFYSLMSKHPSNGTKLFATNSNTKYLSINYVFANCKHLHNSWGIELFRPKKSMNVTSEFFQILPRVYFRSFVRMAYMKIKIYTKELLYSIFKLFWLIRFLLSIFFLTQASRADFFDVFIMDC